VWWLLGSAQVDRQRELYCSAEDGSCLSSRRDWDCMCNYSSLGNASWQKVAACTCIAGFKKRVQNETILGRPLHRTAASGGSRNGNQNTTRNCAVRRSTVLPSCRHGQAAPYVDDCGSDSVLCMGEIWLRGTVGGRQRWRDDAVRHGTGSQYGFRCMLGSAIW
jgi:hypothetical protein